MRKRSKWVNRLKFNLLITLCLVLVLGGSVVASGKQAYTQSVTSLQATGVANAANVSIAGEDILFWVPADAPGIPPFVNNEDYIVVAYGKDGFIVANVNADVGNGTLAISKVNAASIINSTSDAVLQSNFMNWLVCMPDVNSGDHTRYVSFTGYNKNHSYNLFFSTKYGSSYYKTTTITNKLEYIAKSGVSKENMYAIECLIRMYGSAYETDAARLVSENSNSLLYYNARWKDQTSLSQMKLVRTADGCTLTENLAGSTKELPNLYKALKTVADDEDATSIVTGNKYSALSALSKVVGTIEGKVAESDESAADEAAEAIRKGNVADKTAYQKWVDAISSFILTDGAANTVLNENGSVANGYANYDISRFTELTNSQRNNASTDQKDTLSDEEILRLRAFMYCAANLTTMDRPALYDTCNYPTSYSDVAISTSGYNTADVKELAEAVVEKVSENGTEVSTVNKVMQNLDDIVKYTAAKVYGYKNGDPFEESNVEDLTVLSDSEYLESITPDTDEVITTLTYGVYLTRMTKMQSVTASQEAYDAYLQLNYMLMLAATYAQNDSTLTADVEGVYHNSVLDNFLTEEHMANALTTDTSSIANYLMPYLAIYRAFDYLGVEPFTPQLKAICGYYNSLISFEENETYKSYNPNDKDGEAMRAFFSMEDQQFSDDYQKGVALSSTYIPLETNLYNSSSLAYLDDTEWVQKFHYAFGFYRKALYIDTDINAAVNYYVTDGKKGSQRVATLSDLLEPEKDIVLYVDDNFYNVKQLAEMQGYSYTKLANTEEAGEDGTNTVTEDIADWWAGYTDTNIENVVKTGSVNTYSKNIKKKASEYQSGEDGGSEYVLTDSAIDQYLTVYSDNAYDIVYDEYTPLQSFAIVSAIYRQTSIYNVIFDRVADQKPVFVSSPNLAAVNGVELEQFNTIFNYIMLKNLKGSLGIDYKTTLDLDSPLYIDIYGNIVTESGLVVIPAVSNSTLCNPDMFNIYNAGFLSLYNNGDYALPATYNNSDIYMDNMFEIDEESGTWEISNKRIANVPMNFKDIPLSNAEVINTFKYIAEQNLHSSYLPFEQRVWMITEVLRGAPVENIDKEFEGLKGNTDVNKYGIYFAYKLDEIAEQLLSSTNGNSIITLPNLAYMTGVEYIVLFAFKIIFAVLFALTFFKVYLDATQGVLGIKTIASLVISVVMFLVSAFSIPALMDISYYQVNKQLLRDEVQYIEFLNLEKKSEGREIGVYDITEPETKTELYIKIDDLAIPWYEILDDVLFASTFDTIDDVYAEKFDSSLMASLPGVVKKGNGLYMSVADIFDSTAIEYLPDENALYSNVLSTPYSSYITPYYVVLDELIARINYYNHQNNIQNYSTKIQSKGAVKTIGMIEPYLTSEYFMSTSLDVVGMKNVHGIDTILTETHVLFDEEDQFAMQNSLWYMGDTDKDKLETKIDELDAYARAFVVDNKELLGKVTDDTFLKVMAMSIAVEYNDKMGVSSGNAIEIYDVDSRDLLRLSLEDKQTVLSDASKSFARFVYSNGGTIGIVFTALLLGVYFLVSIIKPLCIFVIIGSTIASVVIRRLIKRDDSKALEGFLITLTILCGINVLYGVLLKGLMWLPELGVTFVVAAVLQTVLQIAYVGLLVFFTGIVLADWRDYGFNKYQQMAYRLGMLSIEKATVTIQHATIHIETSETKHTGFSLGRNPKAKTENVVGGNILESMRNRDERREGNNGKK